MKETAMSFVISGCDCVPTEFVITESGHVYVHNPEIGFFRHEQIEKGDALKNHLFNMVMEGFTIEPNPTRITKKHLDAIGKIETQKKGMQKSCCI